MLAASSSERSDKPPETIVHAIMASKLPPQEKELIRVFEDLSSVTAAGITTTATALLLILVNVFSNADMLERLRAELTSLGPTNIASTDVARINFPELKSLEQLPFLTAVLMEGLRLSPAVSSRLARIAPDRDLYYGSWTIPAGTPVGMTPLLMHTDETLYLNPHKFDPDRWMDPDKRGRFEKFYAPFSKGARNCVGMQYVVFPSRPPFHNFVDDDTLHSLAWAEMYLIVAVLALRYDFRMEAKVEDFVCSSDQFAIGTNSRGFLKTSVTARHG